MEAREEKEVREKSEKREKRRIGEEEEEEREEMEETSLHFIQNSSATRTYLNSKPIEPNIQVIHEN